MLPLCCLSLAFAWPRAFWARTVALVLLAWSLVMSMISAVAGMFAPSEFRNLIVDFLLPTFLTPEKLLKSLPIVLVRGVFGLLFFPRGLAAGGYSALIGKFFNGIGRKQTLPSGERASSGNAGSW